ncbi:tRNA uridine-5-carboxymethylaminomethyl(34) synthesis GTPase MnmE [Sulfitobacter sp. JB4-11]|uniref:tRNA uridine-5-carboxymethylaminomethyl(34) synthesis GTPase MnmE n=1 Tax=Sulfitobacter rhodophyticola TaxID=3238304 RepID=UPI003515DC6C
METIFAQATAMGRAGVCVVRLSGPRAFAIAEDISGTLPEARMVALRKIRDREGGLIDTGLVVAFPGPHSFTGEDIVELHLHGSIAVVRAVLAVLARFDGARLAEPGEFTRRALENERLDLTQVEGLADLIDAETEAQRKQALRVVSGHLGELVEGWRADLIRAAALLEATIDFADEDVPVDVTPEVEALLARVQAQLQAEIAGSHVAERIRTGFEVAILGAPNAGKSTLLNALAGREAAITSEIAGTTRDVIEVRMDLGGLPVTLLDTAGLRESDDAIEAIGVSRALARADEADVRVFLSENPDDLIARPRDGDIVLLPKADLRQDGAGISGKTGQGVESLIAQLQNVLASRTSAVGVATHARHRSVMETAINGLLQADLVLQRGPDQYELAAEELRHVIRALEGLIGRVDVEALLDEIFASFCLGK